jgi:two-component system sensor histidine kinase TctE
MARLDEVLSFQNRFIADAAHQLRTPVAGLKGAHRAGDARAGPGHAKQSLAHLMRPWSASRAWCRSSCRWHATSQTRSSARARADRSGKLAFDVTMEWVPEAYKRKIDLGFEGSVEHVMVQGDATRLTELIVNLLDNAIRYSREGGRVTVRVTGQPNAARVHQRRRPTIPVAERQRVFERFHRLLGTHQGGSGLGLAIVREIAALHEAHITLEEDADGVGNTFTVAFPQPAPAAAPAV